MMDVKKWIEDPKRKSVVKAIAEVEEKGETCRIEMHFKNGELMGASKFIPSLTP